METVAFYSYKGGVGRSMLLAHAARYLAARGKCVVALDFDFEAPGLHYKFGVNRGSGSAAFNGGVVPYLIAAAQAGASPPQLADHIVVLPAEQGAEISLMPAGPAPGKTYWAALKKLGDTLHFAGPGGQGLMALLDLQARIADEIKPDYLLIDARTGVTELGSLATTLLADTVVCMFTQNRESLDGMKEVVRAINNSSRLVGQKPIRVAWVLSRDPAPQVGEVFLEQVLGSRVFLLPHDYVPVSEQLDPSTRLYRAYLEIFGALFPATA